MDDYKKMWDDLKMFVAKVVVGCKERNIDVTADSFEAGHAVTYACFYNMMKQMEENKR